MLYGVGGEKHGLTYDIVLENPYPEDSPYPSIFKLLQQQRPEAKCASLATWEAINTGLIELSLENIHRESPPLGELASRAAEYIKAHGKESIYTFIVFDDPDAAGHRYGWETDEYYRALEKSDEYVGIILDAIKEAGLEEDSLILLVTDHGGHEKGHGSLDPRDTTVFWAARGKGIEAGSHIPASFHVKATAAVAAYALGLECPSTWDAQVPEGLFQG